MIVTSLSLPKILIIDDQFGSSHRERRNLCVLFGLKDITGDDDSPELVKVPVAEAMFCSGQVRVNGKVENSVKLAHDAVAQGWGIDEGWRWSLILLDLRFTSGVFKDNGEPEGRDGDDTFGLSILDDLHRGFPDIPVIVMSIRERAGVIEECRKKGASDFIQRAGYGTEDKPPREILLQKILEHGLIEDNRIVESEKLRIVGRSVSIMKALRDARRAATGAGNILLIGETGTGKELLARYIHDFSPRSGGPYKVFHPFGTAETLQEDELFGHEKGAFTGALSVRQGIFESTSGGTLFIDELGDMPEALQNKLLRPIESRQISRQGGTKEIPLDIQVVLATNKDLDEYARTGKFKIDLLNRVKAYTINIPPLRGRKEDIQFITEHLLESLSKENNARWPRKVLSETLTLLIDYDWPDNVRGLRNVLERAIKNNKDSELLVPSDIKFEQYRKSVQAAEKRILPEIAKEDLSIDRLTNLMEDFHFPRDYSKLHGRLPDVQKAIAKLLTNYLLSAIEVSKKRRPGNIDGELNIAGAVSCMMGEQLKTPKAADIIKKLFKADKDTLTGILGNNPSLKELYREVLRLRPSKPNNNSSK